MGSIENSISEKVCRSGKNLMPAKAALAARPGCRQRVPSLSIIPVVEVGDMMPGSESDGRVLGLFTAYISSHEIRPEGAARSGAVIYDCYDWGLCIM